MQVERLPLSTAATKTFRPTLLNNKASIRRSKDVCDTFPANNQARLSNRHTTLPLFLHT